MEYATFREWLGKHGCRFDTQHEERGDGHGTVTIQREGVLRNCHWLVLSMNSIHNRCGESAKRSVSSGPIFPDRKAVPEEIGLDRHRFSFENTH
jgi:hypothetical protein